MARPLTAEMEIARNDAGREPILVYVLRTKKGSRFFTEHRLPSEWGWGPRAQFDSTLKFDATNIYGGTEAPWIDQQARLLDIGSIRLDVVRNVTSVRESLAGRTAARDNFSVDLDNGDAYFRDIVGAEPLMASEGGLILGFKDLDFREHIELAPMTPIVELRWRGTTLKLKHRR